MSTGRSASPDPYAALLTRAHELASAYISSLAGRPVRARESADALIARLGGPLPERSQDPAGVIEALARDAEPGLVATAGPRYFGFVIGGSYPVAVAADWLTSAWDQNSGLHIASPAASAIEEVARQWLIDLLGVPAHASIGFVTGGHMANTTALAAARHDVLGRAGWDVEADGLQGAPRVTVVAGAEAHSSIPAACRLLGLGASTLVRVDSDDQGRMRAGALVEALARVDGPVIVCAQAGNVNTGAFDPLEPIAQATHERGGWLHVDGAFGLWAAAVPALRHQVSGLERADSWATDAHKWLNVPYDCGIVMTAHPKAHGAAMSHTAAYLVSAEGQQRDPLDWVPELSRRGRGITVYATLRALGRRGVQELVTRCCAHARFAADRLRPEPGATVLNDVVLNQVLLRVADRAGANVTPAVIAAVQQDGVCWLGGTQWAGEPAMRISVSGWATTARDMERSVDSILAAIRRVREA
ncbi:MAG: aspartate aminotransferase family protein [Acidobacteria bacterium]|nr:aspartate aminotransferase family protein [Acidobacteriota bacterium]